MLDHAAGRLVTCRAVSEAACPQCANPCESAHKFCPVCGFPLHEIGGKSDDPLIGTTLPGGYVILELVGVGGMGRVYRAEQKALGRTVAVKIIHPHLLGDENASVRFITEARAASRLNHPNSVAVIDFGKNGDQLYLVMEFLRGRDLARVVYEDGPLPFRRIVDVMCQVLAALAEAHHLDIIHRDLKPENIVLEPMRSGGDFVKVVDFGLAKMKVEVAPTSITMPGIVCGTPDYMAPEQGRGDLIDGRSDLYGVGVILYQLLTGRLPFEAESPTQVVLMHLGQPPVDPRKVVPDRCIPDSIAEVCLHALEKDPNRRYQTADEFAAALREALLAVEPPKTSGSQRSAEGVACLSCGSMVPQKQKFCGECGARVVRSADREQPSTLAGPGRRAIDARLPLPFTAREDDLAWLEARRAEIDGGARAVYLVGEHGVGKSRLIHEFLRAAARAGDHIVETGPDPWGAEVGYYAVRKAITDLAGLPPGGGDPSRWIAAAPEARAGLVEIYGRRGDGAGAEPRPSKGGSTTRPPVGPEQRRAMAAAALRWAAQRGTEGGTRRAVLAIDDLHAIDGASRNAFADVIAEPPRAPLLVVAAYGPAFELGWAGPVLRVAGLPTTVAASLVKGVAAPRRTPTGGDQKTVPPLYIEHLVRFNAEGGGEPPARIADLIALRIERLPPDARRTLQAVAVLGDATDRDTLSRMLPDLPGFDRLVAQLVDAGMIEEEMRSTVGPRTLRPDATRLRTTHPLVRDVTLASIPAAVRRDLHAAAASVDDPPLEVQALHAYHAQDSFEALMLLEQVANRAAARGDPRGAVLALRRGLDIARREMFRGEIDDPERAVLIFSQKLGEALAHAGDLTDADGVLREALDLTGPSGPDRAQILGLLATVSKQRDRPTEAASYLREALKLAWGAQAGDLVRKLERLQDEWGPLSR
jgi:serine/threonine-protein kinase